MTTHAGFKALLFLCSGVFIHHVGSNDMFEIGRQGGRRLKIPMICITIAAAALAGLAVGFWGGLDELPCGGGSEAVFQPVAKKEDVEQSRAEWRRALERAKGWEERRLP